MELRTVQILKGNEWVEVEFGELKLGDTFRMFESTGEPVIGDKGVGKWAVTSTPYPTNKEGVMAVEIEN